ncbi:MAG: 2OG-Fe(II) oxygenase [Bacteroidetes bacterium]|nr:2OG-Fe(II) oxygenase [Bacteroidota bacterium]MBP6314189.1 2OG-Fe(II) oxygenase [Chitinophagaceae bacterium]
MQTIFDTIIDSYLENKVGIAENFLSPLLSEHLKQNLMALYFDEQLLHAGTGNEMAINHNSKMRGDKIYWLDRLHKNTYENDFFDLMDDFILYLNRTCYTGITGYEFHYTLYEKGRFYKKHLDQFRNNKSRAFSMIMYLNTDWQKEDGGELCIHHQHHLQNISPLQGKSVFFKSDELEHEVLLTNRSRMSITGWLKIG